MQYFIKSADECRRNDINQNLYNPINPAKLIEAENPENMYNNTIKVHFCKVFIKIR